MVKTNTKYYTKSSGIHNSNSLPRMRLNAIKALKSDPLAYDPVSIYTDSYLSGIYPVNRIKILDDGTVACYTEKREIRGIAKDGTLVDLWKGAFFIDVYKGRY